MKTPAAQAAAMIRKTLKQNGIKASVRSEVYSMGSSVDVTIKQDVTPAALAEIKSYCSQFQMGHFDGMYDIYENSNSRDDIPQAKFVTVRVEYSDELKQAAKEYIGKIGGIDDWDRDRYEWMVINGQWDGGEFWRSHKPRVRLG